MLSVFAGFLGTCLLLTLTDSLYYGDLTLQKLYTFEGLEWSDWKCTPAAYIMHNFVPGGGVSSNASTTYNTFTSIALHAVKSLCLTFGPLGKYNERNVPLLLKIVLEVFSLFQLQVLCQLWIRGA